jgi:hypothetical protein
LGWIVDVPQFSFFTPTLIPKKAVLVLAQPGILVTTWCSVFQFHVQGIQLLHEYFVFFELDMT